MIQALAYVSSARHQTSGEGLRRILDRAVSFNRMAGVTGILLYDGARFFQYIEGPVDGITAALGRIENSSAHKDLRILVSRQVERRAVPYWAMRVFPEEVADIDALIAAEWNENSADSAEIIRPSGFDQLAALIDLHERSG